VSPSAYFLIPERGSFPTSMTMPMSYTWQAEQLRHGSKARYGWVANPYRKPLLIFLPTGAFTLQDTPSFPRRDNDKISGTAFLTVKCYGSKFIRHHQ